MKNRKELLLQALVNSRCTHTGINRKIIQNLQYRWDKEWRSHSIYATGSRN